MAFASQVVEPGALVFEIGANVGTETLALSALVGSSGRVVAVEPVSENLRLLRSRVEAAEARNVTIVPHAVDAAATALKVAHYDPRFSGAAHLAEVAAGEASAGVPGVIAATTLDALCAEFGDPGCVFMDIEGFELRALRGGACLLQRRRPFLFLEVDSAYLARAGSSLAELFALLRFHDYRAYRTSAIAIPEVRSGAAARRLHEDWIGLPAELVGMVPRVRAALIRMRLMPRVPGLNPLAMRRR
jgi:FkbM family methyltransferase